MRKWHTDESTAGEMHIDGAFECFILEPPKIFEGKENVPDKTCIPAGVYELKIQYSVRVGRRVPRYVAVPGRDDILIHPGNFPKDTHGCQLPGYVHELNYVGSSHAAFTELLSKIDTAISDNEKVEIVIIEG